MITTYRTFDLFYCPKGHKANVLYKNIKHIEYVLISKLGQGPFCRVMIKVCAQTNQLL